MAENPQQHDDPSKPQDQDLEAQLDALLSDLEAVEPKTVPADLRKTAEPEEEVSQPEPEPVPAPVDETPTDEIAEAVGSAVDETTGEAVEAEPQPIAQPAFEQDEAGTVETQTQPEPVAASEDTGAEKQPQDLDAIASMAAALLDQQIEKTINDASGPAAETPEDISSTVAEVAPANKPVALGEDELGAQIDALLSNVRSQSAASPAEVAAEPEPVPVAVSAKEEATGKVDADGEGEALESEAADAVAVSIEQIDAMLADSAEKAIEDTANDQLSVPGTDEILAAQAEAEAAEAEAQAQAGAEAQALADESTPTPVEPQAVEAVAEEASPEPVAVEPQPAPVGGATAADVAQELDEQPEPAAVAAEPQAVAAEPESASADTSDEGETAPAVVIHQGGLKKAEARLLKVCGAINSPLYRLSPEMRNTVGWVGVVTLGLGFAFFVYGLLF